MRTTSVRNPRKTKQQIAEEQRRGTAYHEAGHIVAAVWMEIPFKSADIVLQVEQNRFGCVENEGLSVDPYHAPDEKTKSRMDDYMIMIFAGPASEALYSGHLRWRFGSDDLHNAIETAWYRHRFDPAGDIEAYMRYMWQRTFNFLVQPRTYAEVTAVAEALFSRRQLSPQEAEDIMVAASYPDLPDHTIRCIGDPLPKPTWISDVYFRYALRRRRLPAIP